MPADDIAITIDPSTGSATVLLNRADKRNAVTYDMWVSLGEICLALGANTAVRAVVLRGAGEHFCAGADITELRAFRPPEAATFMQVNAAAEERLVRLPRPTIAAVSGDCIGGGTALAVDCDIRIATRSARFGVTPARLGIAYPPASVERLTHLLGPAQAAFLLFTGELIGAEQALRIGLVHEVVDDGAALDRRVAELTATLSERSLLSQLAAKEMIADVVRHGAVSPVVAQRWTDEVARAGDPAEGVAAFTERRPARFTWTP
jgi:enoyl-CoA hydratase/carnithine racemase